jgi:hypothetical protein
MTDATHDILLQKLEEHEAVIASLYEAFAKCLPEMTGLWSTLVGEEKTHASWLKALRHKLETEGGLLDRKSFNAAAVQTSIDYVTRIIARTASEPFTPMKALTIALDLEISLIEKDFFRILATDTAAVRQLFEELKRQTAAHQKRLEDQLSAERAKRAK